MANFPTSEWVEALMNKLNSDQHYAQIARNWEGDMRFTIDPDGALTDQRNIYLDLWHGQCRFACIETNPEERQPAFILKAPYGNFARVVKGELDPMQALMTRRLQVEGNMMVIMRSVPVVLDFVRCCREVTDATI